MCRTLAPFKSSRSEKKTKKNEEFIYLMLKQIQPFPFDIFSVSKIVYEEKKNKKTKNKRKLQYLFFLCRINVIH